MALINEGELLDLITAAVRKAVRDELDAAGDKDPRSREYLDVATAAAMASVSGQTVRGWVRQGRLTRYSTGRSLRVRRDELEALLAAGPDRSRAVDPATAAIELLNNKRRAGGRR